MDVPHLELVHANPWGDEFLDFPALNAHASDAIEVAIKSVRETAQKRPLAVRAPCLTVLGPAGAGKTHLFGRLRRRLGPRAVFVHVRPLLGVEMTHRFVLHEIVRQLSFSTGGLRQIDALVGSLLAYVNGSSSVFPRLFVEDCALLEPDARTVRLEEAINAVLETWQELDESYLRRLLAVPFQGSPTDRALLTWLSGRELDPTQAERLGTSGPMGEELVVLGLKTLAAAASVGAPIVVVFDQLENLIDREVESSRLLAYGQLITDLVDTVHGLVIVQMALDTEWDRSIAPSFNLAQQSRLAMDRHILGLPNPKEKEELLRLWLESLPGRASPFPWPLRAARVAALCEQPGMTPRMLLIALRQALHDEPLHDESLHDEPEAGVERAEERPAHAEELPDEDDEPTRLEESLRSSWNTALVAARGLLDEAADLKRCVDPNHLIDGIVAAVRFVPELRLSSGRSGRPAQIVVTRGASTIHVAILHQSNPKSIGATLGKLADLARKQDVIVVREQAHEFLPSWTDTLGRRDDFVRSPRARWHWLEREDAARLIAVDELLKAARSGDVTDHVGRVVDEACVVGWIERSLDIAGWPLTRLLRGETCLLRGESSAETPARSETGCEEVPRLCVPSELGARGPASTAGPGVGRTGVALSVLARLRLASLDRVIREVVRVDKTATRASVLAELHALSPRLQWFGRTLVYLREES